MAAKRIEVKDVFDGITQYFGILKNISLAYLHASILHGDIIPRLLRGTLSLCIDTQSLLRLTPACLIKYNNMSCIGSLADMEARERCIPGAEKAICSDQTSDYQENFTDDTIDSKQKEQPDIHFRCTRGRCDCTWCRYCNFAVHARIGYHFSKIYSRND